MMRRRNWLNQAKVRSTTPAMFSEMLTCFDAASGDAGNDASGPQIAATAGVIVTLVGVQFARPFSWPSARLPDRLKRVDGLGGFGPIASPLFWREWPRRRPMRATSRLRRD